MGSERLNSQMKESEGISFPKHRNRALSRGIWLLAPPLGVPTFLQHLTWSFCWPVEGEQDAERARVQVPLASLYRYRIISELPGCRCQSIHPRVCPIHWFVAFSLKPTVLEALDIFIKQLWVDCTCSRIIRFLKYYFYSFPSLRSCSCGWLNRPCLCLSRWSAPLQVPGTDTGSAHYEQWTSPTHLCSWLGTLESQTEGQWGFLQMQGS